MNEEELKAFEEELKSREKALDEKEAKIKEIEEEASKIGETLKAAFDKQLKEQEEKSNERIRQRDQIIKQLSSGESLDKKLTFIERLNKERAAQNKKW